MTSELSLTVPIVNTCAFLFTVIGEWWVEKKVISRGMFYFLLCHEPRLTGRRYYDWDGVVYGGDCIVCS